MTAPKPRGLWSNGSRQAVGLATLRAFTEEERSAFANVAPVAQSAAIEALGRALSPSAPDVSVAFLARLLWSLAHDAARFDRCASLLIRCLNRDSVEPEKQDASYLTSFFSIY